MDQAGRLSPLSKEFQRRVAVTFIPDNDRARTKWLRRGTWSIFGGPAFRWYSCASNYDFVVIIYDRLSGPCPRSQRPINRILFSLQNETCPLIDFSLAKPKSRARLESTNIWLNRINFLVNLAGEWDWRWNRRRLRTSLEPHQFHRLVATNRGHAPLNVPRFVIKNATKATFRLEDCTGEGGWKVVEGWVVIGSPGGADGHETNVIGEPSRLLPVASSLFLLCW